MGPLPEGYRVSYFRYGPQPPDEALLFTLSRPDDTVVADFYLGDLKETLREIDAAAWRDHREGTLRAIDGGEDAP